MIGKPERPHAQESESVTLESVLQIVEQAARLTKKIRAAGSNPAESLAPTQAFITLVSKLPAAIARLQAHQTELEELVRVKFEQLDADLREECRKRGWQLEGQWPDFYIERGAQVRFDEARRAASVGGVRVANVSIEQLFAALEPQVRSLVPSDFSAPRFLDELASAYDEARRGSPLVPIFDVYKHLIARAQRPQFWRNASPHAFTAISADQFRARLACVLELAESSTTDGRTLRTTAPIDPKEGLFVYQPTEHRFAFIGHLEFEAVRTA